MKCSFCNKEAAYLDKKVNACLDHREDLIIFKLKQQRIALNNGNKLDKETLVSHEEHLRNSMNRWNNTLRDKNSGRKPII